MNDKIFFAFEDFPLFCILSFAFYVLHFIFYVLLAIIALKIFTRVQNQHFVLRSCKMLSKDCRFNRFSSHKNQNFCNFRLISVLFAFEINYTSVWMENRQFCWEIVQTFDILQNGAPGNPEIGERYFILLFLRVVLILLSKLFLLTIVSDAIKIHGITQKKFLCFIFVQQSSWASNKKNFVWEQFCSVSCLPTNQPKVSWMEVA